MHLVIPAHLSLFWVVCHSSRTFPPKELEHESLNRLPLYPYHQTIPSLTSDSWPTVLVLAGCKWVVPESCACSTPMWVHGFSVVHAFAIAYESLWSRCVFLLLIFNLLGHGWVRVFILCILFPSWARSCLGKGHFLFNSTLFSLYY